MRKAKDVSNTEAVACFTRRIQGLEKIRAEQAIHIDGTTYTADQVVAIFQESLDALAEMAAAHGEWKRKVAAYGRAKAAALAADPGLKRWTFARHGDTSQVAHDLGYEPH